ncbi:hypothetical protein SUNI508_05834 [Seiridium unicorne]|uniref:Rhodopsin domain-containing protein n=1 Tax=Seiridium unicorne TaxID=138068 RepID=A0ABR2V3J9_9PEZI
MAVATRQPNVFVAVSITLAAATVAIILRFLARRMTKVPIWWDDFMCIGAFLFGVGWSLLLIMWTYSGLGLHLGDVGLAPELSLNRSLFFCYLVELFYAASLACSKFAVLAFYWRMFRTSNIKIPIITLLVATSIWLILRTFLTIFHCVPVQAFWDKSIPDATCRIDDSKFFFGTVLTHLFLDLAILSLPVLQVRKLQLRSAQKAGVTAMFMFGIVVCIASIIVLVYSIEYDTTSREISWNIAPIMIWATVEVNLAIVSGNALPQMGNALHLVICSIACLPMLRPIFMKAFHRLFPNASVDSSNKQYNANQPKSMMKMSTMRTKSRHADDSDSTHQLANLDNEYGSDYGDEEHGATGARVVITGNDGLPDPERGTSSNGRMGGILVKSETSVQVTQAR